MITRPFPISRLPRQASPHQIHANVLHGLHVLLHRSQGAIEKAPLPQRVATTRFLCRGLLIRGTPQANAHRQAEPGQAAIEALSRAKLLWLDQRQSSGFAASPLRTGFRCMNTRRSLLPGMAHEAVPELVLPRCPRRVPFPITTTANQEPTTQERVVATRLSSGRRRGSSFVVRKKKRPERTRRRSRDMASAYRQSPCRSRLKSYWLSTGGCWCHLRVEPASKHCHSREGGNPLRRLLETEYRGSWIPAFAGMTAS